MRGGRRRKKKKRARGIILEFRSSTLINTNEERKKNKTKQKRMSGIFSYLPFLLSSQTSAIMYIYIGMNTKERSFWIVMFNMCEPEAAAQIKRTRLLPQRENVN